MYSTKTLQRSNGTCTYLTKKSHFRVSEKFWSHKQIQQERGKIFEQNLISNSNEMEFVSTMLLEKKSILLVFYKQQVPNCLKNFFRTTFSLGYFLFLGSDNNKDMSPNLRCVCLELKAAESYCSHSILHTEFPDKTQHL